MILRDDQLASVAASAASGDDWTEAADSTMERRVYYCQNWRADVVALLAENGRIVERAWYEPYGTPHGLNPGDFGGTSSSGDDHYLVPDGDSDADDGTTYLALFGASNALSDTTGSSDPGDGEYGRPNGVIDSDDYFYFLDRAGDAAALGRNVLSAGHDGATASHGAGNLRNRKGLAGYEWDPHVRRYHVRNRVLYPETGRWTRRDPLGYVDGMGLYGESQSMPLITSDPSGLCVGASGCQRPIRNWEQRAARPGEFSPLGPVMPSDVGRRQRDDELGPGGMWPGDSPGTGGPGPVHPTSIPPIDELLSNWGFDVTLGSGSWLACTAGLPQVCLELDIAVESGFCRCVSYDGSTCQNDYVNFSACVTVSLGFGRPPGVTPRITKVPNLALRAITAGHCPSYSSFDFYPPPWDVCARCDFGIGSCELCVGSSGVSSGCSINFNGDFGCRLSVRFCFRGTIVTNNPPCICNAEY